ncbi:utrophin-like, partial [Hyposmocoma kahamanoa]|uniref:utrophin-like n=1 Tax=Hyposmocoma kahamanoa TaxID=1477025 RepID=UPI000E6D6166
MDPSPVSCADKISSTTCSSAVVVLCPFLKLDCFEGKIALKKALVSRFRLGANQRSALGGSKQYLIKIGRPQQSEVDEREDVQKKTFAKWINSQLVKNNKQPVEELVADLRDGEVLLSLLEILTAQQYKRERGRMRVHHVNNVNTALAALESSGVKLVNISAADVVDGNPKLILGLVWSIIVHWQVHMHLRELAPDTHHSTLERTLLAWCRAHTQNYSGVEVRDFTTSWSDGLALNALLHRWRPQLFDYAAVLRRAPVARLEHAFALAHTHLGIPRLLDPEDVHTPRPDKKSIMMYVMCLFQALPHGAEDASPARL